MMHRPRILILSTAYLPLVGGSELAIKHLTDRLTGYNFDLVTGRYTEDMPVLEQMGRVRVLRAGGRLSRLTVLLPKNLMPIPMAITAWRLTRKHSYQCIHAYQASQAAGAAWLLKMMRPHLPLLLTIQEGKKLERQSLILRMFRRLIFRAADRITVISNALARYVRTRSRAPVDLVPNGVDTTIFSPKESKDRSHVVMSVSRLVPKNGLENLVRAMAEVQKRFSNAKLLLVGDGPLKEKLSVISDQLSVKTEFLGTVSHERLPETLNRADLFVRPSLSEGLGTAFLEAMACGVPVIGSAVGGIPDFLHHEKTGLICDPSSPAHIARQIIRICEDDDLRERVTENALQLVRERYDWSVIAQKMGEVYQQMSTKYEVRKNA